MNRRSFIRLVGGGIVLAGLPSQSGCSNSIPADAIAPWQGPTDESDVRRWILGHAILAPNSHNIQPWLVDLRRTGEIALYCDSQRLLPQTDPLYRQIMMSQGTFLELLDIAARERGYRADIKLFPEGDVDVSQMNRRPVAQIRLAEDASVPKDPLFLEILRRHTNRGRYDPQDVPKEAQRFISSAIHTVGFRAQCTDGLQSDAMARIRAIAAEAWRIELTTARTILESYRLLRIGPDEISRHRDGLVLNETLPRLFARLGLFDRTTAPAEDDYATKSQISDFNAKLESTPCFFSLVTEGNDRRIQVEAGRAYARAHLAATAKGLSMHPISQALQEYSEQTEVYEELHRVLDAARPQYTVQMLARLGYARPVEPSPRRDVADIMMSPSLEENKQG